MVVGLKHEKIISAWQEAATDLNIKIKTPFIIEVGGAKIEFSVLVEKFGSKLGTIIFSIDDMEGINYPKSLGFYVSALNEDVYSKYDRAQFIEMLLDWGFFGQPDELPDWYKNQL